ncbi:SLC13 family permease [Shouchella rhizosphaerae]|uniref:Sodium-dependent dicarboxylate transporter SdcS n=1 Tax=Shouchella rhizosphaerae TaxID=866786 RepID=A0ABZ2CVD9_9BACI
MASIYVRRVWAWLWAKHDQVKDLFNSLLKPLSFVLKLSEGKTTNPSPVASAQPPEPRKRAYSTRQRIGLLLGPALFAAIQLFFRPENLEMAAISTLAITSWVATWWVTEAVPIPLASLLPIVLYPLTGALETETAYAPYANNIIFLIMGGFVLALAMEKWGLHKRVALYIVGICGTSTNQIILGFMAATGFLAMWISNTAATMLMVPMALALIQHVQSKMAKDKSIDIDSKDNVFGKVLLLAIAYAASVGGISTMVATPSNAIFVAIADQLYGAQISYGQWMLFGVPTAILFSAIIWLFLTRVAFKLPFKELPGGQELLTSERKALGRMSPEEKIVLVVFILTAFLWVTRSFIWVQFIPTLTDAIIAIAAALALCLLPAPSKPGERMFDWETGKNLPWGIFLLYGCGLSLAAGFTQTGLSDYLGSQLTGLNVLPTFVVLVVVVAITVFMTELMSNGASATMLYPIMGSLAFALDADPFVFMMAACLATSAAFMLPVSTPPNAVVFGTGYIRMGDMVRTGFFLNVFIIAFVPLLVYFILPILWGLNVHSFPF